MGLILDLAVAALALVVICSLATLAWTLGVSAVRATQRGRERVAADRRRVAEAEARLPVLAARADAALVAAIARTAQQSLARTTTQRTTRPSDDETDHEVHTIPPGETPVT